MPPPAVSLAGEALGIFLFSVVRLKRRQTLSNLETAFGDRFTPMERERIAWRCYRHFGALIFEFLYQPRLKGEGLARHFLLENPEELKAAGREGRGVLVVTGHLGNWEILASGLAATGLPFAAYAGQQHNLVADAMVNGIRRKMGMETVSKKTAMRGMVRALRGNKVLLLISDQHFSRNLHFVRFFGRPVSCAPGLGSLVRLLNPVIFYAETHKTGRFRYQTRLIPMEPPPPGKEAELDLLELTQRFMTRLEESVSRYPEQYFWMHRRWRPPPSDEELSDINRAFLAGAPATAPETGPQDTPAREQGP